MSKCKQCEELKNKIEFMEEYIKIVENARNEFEKENAEIKNINMNKIFLQQFNQLKAELEQEKAWHKTSDEISKANSEYTAKLKQALRNIKEIAESRRYYPCSRCIYKEILQEISKCEVEDDK